VKGKLSLSLARPNSATFQRDEALSGLSFGEMFELRAAPETMQHGSIGGTKQVACVLIALRSAK
jgi:hypothetical protein